MPIQLNSVYQLVSNDCNLFASGLIEERQHPIFVVSTCHARREFLNYATTLGTEKKFLLLIGTSKNWVLLHPFWRLRNLTNVA